MARAAPHVRCETIIPLRKGVIFMKVSPPRLSAGRIDAMFVGPSFLELLAET
jgi:hypothetical protein